MLGGGICDSWIEFWSIILHPAFNATSLWCLIFSLQTLACELEEKSAQLEMLKLLQGCEKQDQKVNNFCEWQIRSCKPKPSPKIGSVNKAFLFWYWQRLRKYFFRNKMFLFFKIVSWNFQHLFEKKCCETSQNFNSIRQPIEKINYNCLEVSQNSISNRCWQFQLSILKNKNVFFLKKVFFRP